jgi:hypothetical protein
MRKIAIITLLAAITACNSPRYYQTVGTLTVAGGKPVFKPQGEKKPLTDTTINNIILISKHK